MDLRPGDKVDIPVDTGEAEHVLILQIAAVTPFVDLDRDNILTFHQVFGDVELGIVVRALAVTYFLPIDPDIEGRVNPVEMEEYLFAGSIFMDSANTPDFSDPNTIVYGHNMKSGNMFGRLKKYLDRIEELNCRDCESSAWG